MVNRATETTALQMLLAWLQSARHRFRRTACGDLSSAQSGIAAEPEQWLLKGNRRVFKLLYSRKYGQKKDRERSEQHLSLPSPRQVGENEQSLVFITSVPILGRRFRQGIPARSIPLVSCIFCTARGASASFPTAPTSPLQGPPSPDSLPKLHIELARVHLHPKACSQDATLSPVRLTALLPTTGRLYNHPGNPTLPTAERGRLCIKRQCIKKGKNTLQCKSASSQNKVLKARTGELIRAGYKRNRKDSREIKRKGFH